jgi:hypothetical protein
MSVRLFHEHTRIVLPLGTRDGTKKWYAIHRRPISWTDVFGPALLLVGLQPEATAGGLRFGGGRLEWTTGLLGTSIRLQLPACSEKKAVLLEAGLLKAARYALVSAGR